MILKNRLIKPGAEDILLKKALMYLHRGVISGFVSHQDARSALSILRLQKSETRLFLASCVANGLLTRHNNKGFRFTPEAVLFIEGGCRHD